MFGLDENEKQLRELLAACGCEASVFKAFSRAYEKANKKYPSVEIRYRQCLELARQAQTLAVAAERLFQGTSSQLNEEEQKQLLSIAKGLKGIEGSFDHEFIISESDKEFHKTYSTLTGLLPKYAKGGEKRLLVQSEVENLLALLTENLERKEPDLFAYAYFLSDHRDSELFEMSPEAKRNFIRELLWTECTQPVLLTVRKLRPDLEQDLRHILHEMNIELLEK